MNYESSLILTVKDYCESSVSITSLKSLINLLIIECGNLVKSERSYFLQAQLHVITSFQHLPDLDPDNGI